VAVAIAVILGLISVAIVMYPIASRWGVAPRASTRAAEAPEAQAILHKISDLDADFERGTTPEDVYTELRETYVKELEASGVSDDVVPQALVMDEATLDDEIESQIAGIRKVPQRPAARPKALVCSNCSAPHEPNAKFCPYCGTRLIDDGSN
jgi:hypothetical protein